MSVMVIGGNGFVGSHVIRELINHGQRPVCYDLSQDSPILADLEGRFERVQGDVLDLGQLVREMQAWEVDRVVALTSLVTFASQQNPPAAYRLNVGSTLNILEASRILPLKRIVYASSLAVYGRTPAGRPVKETSPLKPASLYGATKVFCEELGAAYNRDHGGQFVALRFPGMWGPGQGLMMKGKSSLYGSGKFADIVEKPARGEIAIIPGLADKYELLYIKDARKLVRLAAFAEKPAYQAYNAGCESFNSLQEIAGLVREQLPEAAIRFESGISFPEGFDFALPARSCLDIGRARRDLGYEPEFKPPVAVLDYLKCLKRQAGNQ